MTVLNKIWSILMALLPTWILAAIPYLQLLRKNQELVHRREFVDIILGGSLFKDDKILEGSGITGDELPKELRLEAMPRHVAVILDGNRRWAKQRGLTTAEGYEAGLGTLCVFLTLCRKWKIPIVSLFMFSSENWLRPKEEVDYLMELVELALKYYLMRTSRRYGARISVIGDRSKLPNSLQKSIQKIEEDTKSHTEFHLILAISYSGQDDIVHACQTIAKKVNDGHLQLDEINKSVVEQHLHTQITDVPAPDLLVRTSGEIRISNYYLWQSAYSEMYFTDTLWPDFGKDEFVKALCSFQQRGRRFGKV